MHHLQKNRKLIIYTLSVLTIIIFQSNSKWIEDFYFSYFYTKFSIFLRYINSVFPFSVGDLFYVALVIYVLRFLYCSFYLIKNRKTGIAVIFKKIVLKIIIFCCQLFLVFKIFWGLNYNREGVAKQFGLRKEGYCKEQLNDLIDNLIEDVNNTRALIKDTSLPAITVSTSFNLAVSGYNQISEKFSFLAYHKSAIKPSLYSNFGNYFGFIGYFNPFTGEAQVRNDIPAIMIPFVATHEIGHQLGYASESEASFIGFLVCYNSNNEYLKYSAQLEILALALNELPSKYLEDGCGEDILPRMYQINNCLTDQVKRDRYLIRNFFEQNRTSFSNVSNDIYDSYLKLNSQYTGISSYSEVLDWIMVYNK